MKFFNILLISWKFFRLLVHLLAGLIMAHIFLRQGIHANPRATRLTLWWHRHICQIFESHISLQGKMQTSPTLFVMNHISWFDIPLLASQQPLHFLSKAELKKWPLIGWLAQHAGTLFIERGAAGAAQKSLNEITHCLQQGHSVVVFPEGTTTDGSWLRTFHGRLLQAAIDAQVGIQPIALRYPYKDGLNPYIPYIDDMQPLDSFAGLADSLPLKVELQFLPVIDIHLQDAGITNKQLAQNARQLIAESLNIKL